MLVAKITIPPRKFTHAVADTFKGDNPPVIVVLDAINPIIPHMINDVTPLNVRVFSRWFNVSFFIILITTNVYFPCSEQANGNIIQFFWSENCLNNKRENNFYFKF